MNHTKSIFTKTTCRVMVALVIALLATSCLSPEYKEVGENFFVREFAYNGHKYIEFKDNTLYGQGFVHDPDCPCHEADVNEKNM